jgi:hypothetical protein
VSERSVLLVLRGCIAVWGLLWIAAGVVRVAFPDFVADETPKAPTGSEAVLFAIFTCAFGGVLVLTPRFFARHLGGFFIMLLVALALPIMTLVLSTVTLRSCLSITALCFFPVLMQILLVLNARTKPAG